MEIVKKSLENIRAFKFEAFDREKAIGHAYLYLVYNDLHKEPCGLMEDVYVNEDYRGRGIGKRLVESVIEEAKAQGCYKLLGTSRHSRPRVHEMYKGLGFKDWGLEFRMDFTDSTEHNILS